MSLIITYYKSETEFLVVSCFCKSVTVRRSS